MLGGIGGDVDFQKDIYNAPVPAPPLVNRFQKMQAVDRLDQGDIRKDKFQLIGLEMADEMPLDIGGKQGNLCGQFLRAAFGENTVSGIIRLADTIYGVKFGNCHQGDA